MEPKWEWVDTISGVILGGLASIGAMTGWISPKLAKIEADREELRADVDERLESVHERMTASAQELARLRAHREDDQRRLEKIDEKLDRILDRVTHWLREKP